MSDVVRWTENDKTNNNENHNNIRVSDEYNTSPSTKQDSEYSSCCRSFSKSVNNAIIDKNQTSRIINNNSNSNKTSRSDSSRLDSCSVAALRVEHSWNSECILRHTKTIKTTKTKLSVKNYLVTKIMSNVKANENGGVRKRNDRSFYKSISLSYLFVILQINILLSNFIVMVCASDQLYTTGNYTNSRTSNLFGDSVGHTSNDHGHYTSTWAVHIPNGDNDNLADRVAAEHGFINMGKIFDDHYHFHHNKIAKRSLQPSHHHQKRLSNDERILWSRQQRAKSRQKRDFIRMRPTRTSLTLSFAGAIKLNDQKWPQMWYLNRGNDIDMNVIPVWKEGITGKGVVVTILDDGLESDHPDLEDNYDALASYDVNSHDPNPMPRYDMQDTNRHGTRCAGEVAATANNSLCTVGIAYGAKVGGVRMLDGDVTDAVEARSLSLNPQHIDIYSASWGPDDDGKTVDGPGELATQAFIDGVTKGRGGKGSIFIWASGNGGRETDNCNCDGYTNSIWTLSISSATEGGHVPWYSEKCSSTLATTYSSGGLDEKQVITTDLHHACTSSHTGTSASAPLAAGIVALVLEANRNLTWRDLQHIVVRTAKPGNLKDPSWSRNGVGRRVSHSFGYGLMDASAMVKTAKTWKTVPEQQRCEINAPHSDKVIPPKNHITLQLNVQHCMGVNYLEHVQAKITLTSQRRGDIQIYLKSPAGTKVTLLTSRNHDISRSGFNQWPFMSVHTWGEAPHGNWQLEIHNEGRYLGHAALKGWSLIFYGTALPVDKNDPISVRVPITNETISTSSSSTQTHHQTYSSQYPIISPANRNHFPITILGKPNGKTNAALANVGSPNVSSGSNSGINSNSGSSNNGNNNNAGSSNGNSGGGRKQQGNHQSSSHYGTAIVTSPKKNGKNSKNNNNNSSSGNKSNNKNSNNNNNQKSSSGTNRPNYQQLANNQYGNINPSSGSNTKNNFYRLPSGTNGGGGGKSSSNGKQSQSMSSTQRAKLSNFGSGSVSSSSTSNSGSNRSEKLGRLHEKIAIKAPKQVKDNEAFSSAAISTQPPQTSSSSLVNSNSNQRYGSYERIQTQNSRIPKLFEQYEKIQQIFPEFHPYTGPKETPQSQTQHQSSALNSETRPPPNKKQYPFYEPPGGISRKQGFNANSNSNRGSSAASSSSTSHSSSVFTNPKPSRENSKKSQNFQSEERSNGQRGRMYIPNRKNTKAQISQWDMIFYGTSQTPQPDDPVRINPGKYGSYGGEMEHNILDIDSDAASGQWRNLQQVGEAHVDVQRTTSNDLTSKACLSYSTDQKCLECEQTTFLYNGGCYNRCPDETYMVPEYPTIPAASRYRTNSRSESLSLRRRRDEESEMGTYENLNDIIQKQRAIMHPIPQKLCAPCHPTCLKCRGPNQSHCLSCGRGFNLRVVNSDESYCYPTLQGRPLKANLSREAGSLSNDVNFSIGFVKNLNMAYSIVALFVMILVVALIINAYKKQLKSCLLGGNGHDYDRVQFDCESDERQALKSMEYTPVDDDFKDVNKYDPREPPAKIFGVRENIK